MALAGMACLCAGFTYSSPVRAERLNASQQHMVYEVYAGGIHAVQATLDINIADNGLYDITLGAKTRGLLGKMAPWRGVFKSTGFREEDGSFQPLEHSSVATWRDEEESKVYAYNKDGSFKGLTITDFNKKPRTETPDQALTDQTVDVLTATLDMLVSAQHSGACQGARDIFDGKRRFTQVFNPDDARDMSASKYNIFSGTALECSVEVQPVAGAWHKKPRGWMSIQEQGRAKGTMPTVWIGQPEAGALPVPVKILVKTNYGSLFMHLAEYHGSGDIMVAEKRVTEEE